MQNTKCRPPSKALGEELQRVVDEAAETIGEILEGEARTCPSPVAMVCTIDADGGEYWVVAIVDGVAALTKFRRAPAAIEGAA